MFSLRGKIKDGMDGAINTNPFLTDSNFIRGEIRMAVPTISKICRVADCLNPQHSATFCKKHYTRWFRYGDPLVIKRKGKPAHMATCGIDGCAYFGQLKRGMCQLHYLRVYRTGTPYAKELPTICAALDCSRAVTSKGFCDKHYARFRKYGDATTVLRANTNGRPCSFEGCDRPIKGRELCEKHYLRWSRYGDPSVNKNPVADKRMGIYAILNLVTGKQYIGSTVNFGHRQAQHRSQLNQGKHWLPQLQREWDKSNPCYFTTVLLEEVSEPSALAEREQWWINHCFDLYNKATHAWRTEILR